MTGVVFLFLRSARATLIPATAVPVSIIGTFGAMYLLGYSLDNLSLMALTVATGFVVDDAIVVLENISRHVEDGMPRAQGRPAGCQGGRIYRRFDQCLADRSVPADPADGWHHRPPVPGICRHAVDCDHRVAGHLADHDANDVRTDAQPADRQTPAKRTLFDRAITLYGRTLAWSLRHSLLVILVLLVTIGLNVALYIVVPKGFFPMQDTGRMAGGLQADQSISFQAMEQKLKQISDIVQLDPAVETVVGFTGANGGARATNAGSIYVSLKPRAMRDGIETVMTRLRDALSVVPGAKLFLVPVQDFNTTGGRQTNAAYQYTLQSDSAADLYEWAPKLVTALEHDPVLRDVNSDQQQKGLETDVVIDRATASRLGVNAAEIDNTLYDAFGQRQVSTIYKAQNQYHVIMEVAPRYWRSPQTLKDIYVSTAGGPASGVENVKRRCGYGGYIPKTAGATTAATIAASSARNAATNALANIGEGTASSAAAVSTSKETMIPLATLAHFRAGHTALTVNHQESFVANTISFNLAPGTSLSDATVSIERAMRQIQMPTSIRGSFQGVAQIFQRSLSTMPLLLFAALGTIYIVLGILYESYIHPITILSTLPSAGIGAMLALSWLSL